MAAYSLGSKAATDLEEIYEFTIDRFGLQQARTYLTGLSERFDAVAQNPMLGRDASELSPGLRRLVYQSHVVISPPTLVSGSYVFFIRAWMSRGICEERKRHPGTWQGRTCPQRPDHQAPRSPDCPPVSEYMSPRQDRQSEGDSEQRDRTVPVIIL